ncbi:MAG: cyclic pyranopterin monophosphate synthase MoaC [Deltaproteobacteria bacterium]|nr:cyclic pyranopterin monophosphate synthase MoaC [Deltaproteobacteria bacterium]MBW2068002.1 cyclic pyranopterin monophosphate synthase MoaC [Deltaproteobacteria bacterium]
MRDQEWSHIDEKGHVRMVDITEKPRTSREARAEGKIIVSPKVMSSIIGGTVPKGNVFETARIAGIQAAKKTWELIPLCHQLQLTSVNIDFEIKEDKSAIIIRSLVKTTDRTGVEMEALTATAVAALTIYDMCKALDKTMTIDQIQLTYKSGGKSGTFER